MLGDPVFAAAGPGLGPDAVVPMDERATRHSWKTEPFGETTSLPYADTFSASQFEALAKGLIPRAMEDKWIIFLEEQVLYFHRSWTGQPVYQVKIQAAGDGYAVSSALIAKDCLAAGQEVYQAEMLKFLVHNLLLGGKLPFPSHANMKGAEALLYQHHISGTGYPSKPVPLRRWWQFWK